jgi:hypothetical protein
MLASLAAVKDLKKIEMLQSVIKIAMTCVHECAKFIISFAQHGFWGEFALSGWGMPHRKLVQAVSFANRYPARLRTEFSNSKTISPN